MSEVKSSALSKMLLVTGGTLFILLSSELFLRAFNVDLRLLRKTLYYQVVLLPLHRTSSDAQRLFELAPNRSEQWTPTNTLSKEIKYDNKIDISVNGLGFRGREFAPIKKAGVFRIVIFGGSNTFGALVSDEDTYPAQMQKIFDEEYPGKVEVWNAGVSAYVMSQDVAYAETVIKKFDPDLIILQDTNRGRRAFLYDTTFKELKELFRKNNELFRENIPPLWEQVSPGNKIHQYLVATSALYRTFCLRLYTRLGTFNGPCFRGSCQMTYAQMVSNRELNLFTERHKDIKIILFFISDDHRQIIYRGVTMRDDMRYFLLNARDKPPEYRTLHPPPYVYAWYARELCDFLAQEGSIPADILNGKGAV